MSESFPGSSSETADSPAELASRYSKVTSSLLGLVVETPIGLDANSLYDTNSILAMKNLLVSAGMHASDLGPSVTPEDRELWKELDHKAYEKSNPGDNDKYAPGSGLQRIGMMLESDDLSPMVPLGYIYDAAALSERTMLYGMKPEHQSYINEKLVAAENALGRVQQ